MFWLFLTKFGMDVVTPCLRAERKNMTNSVKTDISESTRRALGDAVYRLLKPLVRILLRHGIPFGSCAHLLKQAYVDVAVTDFALPGRKQTDSRISVLTGLTRKDVKEIRGRPVDAVSDTAARYNRAARVISGWIRDRSFLDGWGKPAMLLVEGEGANFSRLVHEYGGDIPVRAVLDELLRVGAVEKLEDGRVKLLQHAYVPNSSTEDKLNILATDVSLLLETIGHNLEKPGKEAYFQRKVAYNNLPVEAVPLLKEMAAHQGQKFLESLNTWLATQDRDSNPAVKGKERKYAGVGVYFFERDAEKKQASDRD